MHVSTQPFSSELLYRSIFRHSHLLEEAKALNKTGLVSKLKKRAKFRLQWKKSFSPQTQLSIVSLEAERVVCNDDNRGVQVCDGNTCVSQRAAVASGCLARSWMLRHLSWVTQHVWVRSRPDLQSTPCIGSFLSLLRMEFYRILSLWFPTVITARLKH